HGGAVAPRPGAPREAGPALRAGLGLGPGRGGAVAEPPPGRLAGGGGEGVEPGAQRGGAGDLLDAQVEGVAVEAAAREVGARLLGLAGSDRMERVDEDHPGAELGGRAPGEAGEVAEVAHAPAPRRAERVELRRPAPGAQAGGEVAPTRADDQPGAAAVLAHQPVIARRQS